MKVTRVLGGDDEERPRNEVRDTVGRDLALFHHLEQRRLRLRAGSVDLVADQHVGEHRALTKRERRGALVEDHHPGDIARQQVGCELHPLPGPGDRSGNGLRHRRLAGAGHVVDEQMAFGQQAAQSQPNRLGFATNDAFDVVDQRVEYAGYLVRHGR